MFTKNTLTLLAKDALRANDEPGFLLIKQKRLQLGDRTITKAKMIWIQDGTR